MKFIFWVFSGSKFFWCVFVFFSKNNSNNKLLDIAWKLLSNFHMSTYLESMKPFEIKIIFLMVLMQVQHQFGSHSNIFESATFSQKLHIALEFSLMFGWSCHKCLVWVGYWTITKTQKWVVNNLVMGFWAWRKL